MTNEQLRLNELLKNGSTVFCTTVHTSKSGLSRNIKAFIIVGDEIMNISYFISKFLKLPLKKDCVNVKGCGMDMQFWLVDALSFKLGIKLNKRSV